MAVDITLANEIRVPRRGEWLCRGLPFPEGSLTDSARLTLKDETGRVAAAGIGGPCPLAGRVFEVGAASIPRGLRPQREERLFADVGR